jgi:hypothetical protein
MSGTCSFFLPLHSHFLLSFLFSISAKENISNTFCFLFLIKHHDRGECTYFNNLILNSPTRTRQYTKRDKRNRKRRIWRLLKLWYCACVKNKCQCACALLPSPYDPCTQVERSKIQHDHVTEVLKFAIHRHKKTTTNKPNINHTCDFRHS